MGDHIYRRREIFPVLERESAIVRPANFPPSAPGREWTVIPDDNGVSVAVFSLLGRVFMRPVDCPWQAADRLLPQIPDSVKIRWLDFHAEATSDMQLMGRHLDGRVSAVLGTHTHVPTADEQILPGGTAFQCDIGMTGPHDGILGRRVDRVLETTITFRPTHFEVATHDLRLHGTIVDVCPKTGHARSIERVVVDEELAWQWSQEDDPEVIKDAQHAPEPILGVDFVFVSGVIPSAIRLSLGRFLASAPH